MSEPAKVRQIVRRVASWLLAAVVTVTSIVLARRVAPEPEPIARLLDRTAEAQPSGANSATPLDLRDAAQSERGVLDFLAQAAPDAQVEMDIAMHNAAIAAGTFDPHGSSLLAEDSRMKARLLDHFRGRHVQQDELNEAVAVLKSDISIHERYLSLPPSPKTGSHEWHRTWIGVYRQWLELIGPSEDEPVPPDG